MKSVLIALVLSVLAGAALLARDVTYRACTTDHKKVELSVALSDEAPASVYTHVGLAFGNAATTLTADELVGGQGFAVFVAGLSDEDRANLALKGPPEVLEGTCQ